MQTTLSKVRETLSKYRLLQNDDDQLLSFLLNLEIEEVIEFLAMFEENNLIYPRVIGNKFKLSTSESFNLLYILYNEDILELNYAFVCPNGSGTVEKIYTDLNDLPEEYYCVECDEYIDVKDSIVLFRVKEGLTNGS